MVMKAAVDDDASGWELSVPEKMEKSSTSWVDITQDFEDACRGEFEVWGIWFKVWGRIRCVFSSLI